MIAAMQQPNKYKTINQLHLETGNFWSNWKLDTVEGFDFDPDIIGRYIIQNYGTFDYFLPMDYPTDAGEWNFTSSCYTWWLRHKDTFQRWYDILITKYDPLYNKDTYEEYTDTSIHKESETNTTTGNSTTTSNSDNSNNQTDSQNGHSYDQHNITYKHHVDHDTTQNLTETNKVDDTTQNNITTFDLHGTVQDPKFLPHDSSHHTADEEKNIYSNDKLNHYEGTDELDDLDTSTSDYSNTNTNISNSKTNQNTTTDNTTNDVKSKEYTDTNIHSIHSFGQDGVMVSSQDLIKKEIELRKFNLYEQIGDLFADEMCIKVWCFL